MLPYWYLFDTISDDFCNCVSFGLEEIVCSFFLGKRVFKRASIGKILLLTSGFSCSSDKVWISNKNETFSNKNEVLAWGWICTDSTCFLWLDHLPQFLEQRDPFNEFYFVTNWISVYVLYFLCILCLWYGFSFVLQHLKAFTYQSWR